VSGAVGQKLAQTTVSDATAVVNIIDREFSRVGSVVSGVIECLQTQSRPSRGPRHAAALMQTAGRGISLRQAVQQEQFAYDRASFVDPVSSRSFGRSHPVTKNATAFMRSIDEYDRS
jgi:hypothetical protein